MGEFNKQAVAAEEKRRFANHVMDRLNGDDMVVVSGTFDNGEEDVPFEEQVTDWRMKYGGDIQFTLKNGDIMNMSDVFKGYSTHYRFLEIK